ncbi:hypothetical protein [Solidesulfovibrio sp. C21]|uniref:hypothetical protein n=1 Tax=Solidesulfovibrio sp. C21 TaxID=3398613 RepID=UPI0039FBA69A
MEIGSATSSFTAGFAVSQKTPTTGTQQADASASPTNDSRTYQRAMGTTAGGASDLLGNNFVHADSGPSKYVAATITNLQTDMSFGDKMGTLLDSLKGQAALLNTKMHVSSHDSTYVVATLMQHKVKDGVKQVTNDEYMDRSADNLDDLKDDIEKRAEEATQPKDASQADTSETTGTNASTDAATSTTDQTASTGQDATATGDTGENGGQQAATAAEAATAAGEGANQQNATASASATEEIAQAAAAAAQGGTTASQTTQAPAQTPPTTASLDILV